MWYMVTARGRRSGVTLLPSGLIGIPLACRIAGAIDGGESRFGNQLLWSISAGLFSCQQANSCFVYPYEHAGVKKSMMDEGCMGFEKTTAFQIWHTD